MVVASSRTHLGLIDVFHPQDGSEVFQSPETLSNLVQSERKRMWDQSYVELLLADWTRLTEPRHEHQGSGWTVSIVEV